VISTAGDFVIVDNSDKHWKALEYLRQWCAISSGIDIATGHFEIGSLLALDGEWQKVGRIRVLLGGPSSRPTQEAVRQAATELQTSLASERRADPFLSGLPAVVDAMRSGQIEARVYRKSKFHAKAYITHSTLDVVGSAALVGSSNFTRPGLTGNVELNVRFTGAEVRDLQEWYEHYWEEAEPLTADLLKVLDRYTAPATPFEVYCKALQALTQNVTPGDHEWETEHSLLYPLLAPYQRDAYLGLKQRARSYGGGMLTDGVGLGKTFVGLMLAEYYAVKERRNVLIVATKTGQGAVWEPEIAKRLPMLQGDDFTNLRVMAHTDLTAPSALARIQQLAARADVIIIDEAHNFRNRGKIGTEPGAPVSRWARMQSICAGKTTFLLTATPINNSLFDLVHELQLFTGDDDAYFAPIGINSLRTYVNRLERSFRDAHDGHHGTDIDLTGFQELLASDELLRSLIVQNSRKYAMESSMVDGAATVQFPKPSPPKAVPYDYDLTYSRLLGELEAAFQRDNPLFILPLYYPLFYSTSPEVDPFANNRQKQVVGLIRTTFLKRFESSLAAFTGSCLDMAERIQTWIRANTLSIPGTEQRLADWRAAHADIITTLNAAFRPSRAADDPEEDTVLSEEQEYELHLDPAEYRLADMIDDAFTDLDQLAALLERAEQVGIAGDTKYVQLRKLLLGGAKTQNKAGELFDPAFAKHKVLVFTEFSDTARYLHDRLVADGLTEVDWLDGSRTSDRVKMIRRLAPHYNGLTDDERSQLIPLRVLISTDVLSEGVNLQDATQIINYDIHWNPVRLMQRIGRIDRRLNPDIEAAIVAETPSTKRIRGTIAVRNFLPNAELNAILSLYSHVQARALLISKTLGIPGGKLLTEDDMFDDSKVLDAFLREYQGDMSPVEQLRLKLLGHLHNNPVLADSLAAIPDGAHTAISGSRKAIFTCTIEPTHVQEGETHAAHWTLDPGRPRWALHPDDGDPVTDLLAIDAEIACQPDTPATEHPDPASAAARLREIARARVNDLRKDGQPVDAPATTRVAWIETTA
jgi:superfamily II DNA or RNA helicase